MDDTWIREEEGPEAVRPMGDPAADVPRAVDPQEGHITRTTDDIPDAAVPTHPDIGGPIGPS